ncbi:MAG: glycosyltransferase family 2 protein [Clostridia bacterium]|nr:glycosyltransferase family 2 protein [Clostridia bacterium]
MKVSVAMAAYNGEKYIEQQLESILTQLRADDEVIVSDDNPAGGTKEAVDRLGDPRIRYVEGPGKGVIKNFEHALSLTTGDIIFLADQDDVWLPGKVAACVSEIENGATLVLHDAKVVDENLGVINESFFEINGSAPGFWKNIKKNSFMGCCMAFDAGLKDAVMPFPDNLPMHDQWIGLIAERKGKVKLLYSPYLLYRRSGDSLTGRPTSLSQKIKWRVSSLKDVLL